MGKLSHTEKVCILISWVVMLMYCTAEREYFPQSNILTWDEARNHCQVCFKDLVTLTPENIQAIVQNLTFDYWIGLRKNFSTSIQNMSWTSWANGDPLTFQNWYPGRPVSKSSLLKRDCCSCSCTCPARPTSIMFPGTTRNPKKKGSTEERSTQASVTSASTSPRWTTPNGRGSSDKTSTPTFVSSEPTNTMITGSTNPNGTSSSDETNTTASVSSEPMNTMITGSTNQNGTSSGDETNTPTSVSSEPMNTMITGSTNQNGTSSSDETNAPTSVSNAPMMTMTTGSTNQNGTSSGDETNTPTSVSSGPTMTMTTGSTYPNGTGSSDETNAPTFVTNEPMNTMTTGSTYPNGTSSGDETNTPTSVSSGPTMTMTTGSTYPNGTGSSDETNTPTSVSSEPMNTMTTGSTNQIGTSSGEETNTPTSVSSEPMNTMTTGSTNQNGTSSGDETNTPTSVSSGPTMTMTTGSTYPNGTSSSDETNAPTFVMNEPMNTMTTGSTYPNGTSSGDETNTPTSVSSEPMNTMTTGSTNQNGTSSGDETNTPTSVSSGPTMTMTTGSTYPNGTGSSDETNAPTFVTNEPMNTMTTGSTYPNGTSSSDETNAPTSVSSGPTMTMTTGSTYPNGTGSSDETNALTSVTNEPTNTMITGSTNQIGASSSKARSTPASVSSAPTMTKLTGSTNQNGASSSKPRSTTAFVTSASTPKMTSLPPIEAECERSPMLMPEDLDYDEIYIEDACVAMLSFGAWVEKDCLELLPFICYEDRFFGQANVTNVTLSSANLSWLPAPGDIDYYRLELKGDKELIENVIDLTYDLDNLTAGTLYSVQVFPVKCDRDLNSQDISFYTEPNKVTNLTKTNVTETSVSLVWNKPDGNVDFYLVKVKVQGSQSYRELRSHTESFMVPSLKPGNLYTFTVLSGVQDESMWSEESHIMAYTKPGKVSDLKANNTKNLLLLQWVRPEGNSTSFRVKAVNGSNHVLSNIVVNQTNATVTGLTEGTKITIGVIALVNGTLEGDEVTIVSYTAPGPVSNLVLATDHNSLNASWNPPENNYSVFTIKLMLDNKFVDTRNLTERRKTFKGLKVAANYTVIVYAVYEGLLGPSVKRTKFTLPSPPTNVQVSSSDKEQITFKWRAPENSAKVTYAVSINSSFWGYRLNKTVDNNTTYTFKGLKSGTKYDFHVRTEADGNFSVPVKLSHSTDADTREISLSMLCSSEKVLLCDEDASKESALKQLQAHFKNLFEDNIFWKLEQQEREN